MGGRGEGEAERAATSALAICRSVYEETRAFHAGTAMELGEADFGFRILYGPPRVATPLLFLGDQPGGGEKDNRKGLADGERESWPETSDYATACWKLAKRIRNVWDDPPMGESTGLNLNFFRSASQGEWRRLPLSLRAKLEEFSLPRAVRIVRALAPRHIVVIGLGTFQRVVGVAEAAAVRHALVSDRGRVLGRTGELWGSPATGVLHLSGAHISVEDRQKLNAFLRERVGG
ncbi:hypothetical protein NVS89_12555 [Ancylobacter sp. MQZ15Z-1]|uniref:Uracil-DNA glycosylase-like domain-containing protein n=1 Tax=Ancylobacter mangrovi TaxID=2972472 RepID=A0A9X2PFE2_9HYPH|nr:hypothetical protein [Ancylobacter mangrovi]MCS0495931.1 hypothetical protein [Ancylobacter mangrovi]